MNSRQFSSQNWYLDDRTGCFEKYTPEFGDVIEIINEKNDADSTNSRYIVSTTAATEDDSKHRQLETIDRVEVVCADSQSRVVNEKDHDDLFEKSITTQARDAVALKDEIRTIIDTNDEVFDHEIINDLTSAFLTNGFLFNFDRLCNTTQSKSIENLIVTLVDKFDNTKHNIAYLSSCLVCVFRNIAKKCSFPAVEMKFKLTVFIDVVRRYINRIDNEMWKSWFLCDMFLDWFFIVASVFIPTENFIRVEEQSLIDNATEYFGKVKNYRYVYFGHSAVTKKLPKPTDGIFELTKSDFGVVKVMDLEESKRVQYERRRKQHKTQKRKHEENPGVEVGKIKKRRRRSVNHRSIAHRY
ncbi:Hypothetical protein CINCED_3A000960 [Cinara cedri]|uniref:Uncharacterized protein n=1 Tax=Cinara cedri TaxID=506608 RepID=A0A5E4N8B9_9HEMI|nr:Hypothetical protein CINCED_3A000960 [Cinara cedri]